MSVTVIESQGPVKYIFEEAWKATSLKARCHKCEAVVTFDSPEDLIIVSGQYLRASCPNCGDSKGVVVIPYQSVGPMSMRKPFSTTHLEQEFISTLKERGAKERYDPFYIILFIPFLLMLVIGLLGAVFG